MHPSTPRAVSLVREGRVESRREQRAGVGCTLLLLVVELESVVVVLEVVVLAVAADAVAVDLPAYEAAAT